MTENEAKIPQVAIIGGDRGAGRILKAHIALLEELEAYRAIGTIEEFKALKEKNEPKKPLFSTVNRETAYHCGSCKKFVGFYDTRKYEYCHNCGTKINWQ